MKKIILLLFCSAFAFAQKDLALAEKFQSELNKSYADSLKSPLTKEDLKQFKGLDFYPINQKYIEPVTQSLLTIQHIKNNVNTSLDHISDLWSQSVLYYFIWKEFNKEVPHNDYADFFSDTYSIKRWLSYWYRDWETDRKSTRLNSSHRL